MSVLTDKDVQEIMDGKAVGVFTKTSATRRKTTGLRCPITDFSAEDYSTGFERGYRAGWRNALDEVLLILDKCRLPIQEKRNLDMWERGHDDAIDAVELRLLALKDGDTE